MAEPLCVGGISSSTMAAEGHRIQGEPINETVEERQQLMIERNASGEVVREYRAQGLRAGRHPRHRRDPLARL